MSQTIMFYGVKKQDDKYNKMQEAYNACESAGIKIPEEIIKYFKEVNVDPDIKENMILLNNHKCFEELFRENEDSYEITLSKLPEEVIAVRFSIFY